MKRKYVRARRTRRGQKNSLTVKRTFYSGSVNPAIGATNQFWSYLTPSLGSAGILFNTTLSGLPNLTEYRDLFDTFKLSAVKYRLVPRVGPLTQDQTIPSTGTTFIDKPMISTLIDPKSQITASGTYSLGTYNTFLELGNVRRRRGDREVNIYWKPLIQEQYGSGALRYIKPRYTNIDTLGQSMPHRGCYVFWHNWNFTSVSLPQYDVYVTYYLKFKGQR